VYRILSPEEATPLLLDRNISPVVSLDTEWDIETGKLKGVSMAGGTPERGIFGCFWSFDPRFQTVEWDTFLRTVILPIFGDHLRTVVMHPINVDIKQLRKRGLTDSFTRCQLEDTVAMAYIYDDNLPHGLKELAYCILLKTTATTHAATQREIEDIRKGAKAAIKEHLDLVWECYQENRKKSAEVEVAIDPTWPGWKRLAMSLPPGLLKNDSAKTGKRGVTDLVRPMIESVIQADYDRRAHQRFSLYGAEDAVYTLMLRYWFKPQFTAQQLEHLALETMVTHPCVTEMEEKGLKVDIPLLEDIAVAMRASFEALRDEVTRLWSLPTDDPANPFNYGSNDQVAARLWVDWRLDPPAWAKNKDGSIRPKYRRAKDGLCKADALILETLVKKYESTAYGEAIQKLLDLRGWEKLIGTYVEPILVMAKSDPDGRVHSSFWPTGARSGRFSSSDPNVENIPRDSTMPTLLVALGMRLFGVTDPFKPPRGFVPIIKKNKDVTGACAEKSHAGCASCATVKLWRVRSLREIFIASPGYVLVSADLSQIENRFTAFESRDPTMLDLYRRWDCFECKQTGLSNVILHACPNCGAKEGKRDKSKPEQPVIKGFVHGKDIHSATAAYLGFFEKYGEEGRQQAKPVNHAATYGMGAQTFSKREGVPVQEADANLRAWHRTYLWIRGDLDRAIPGTLHARVLEDITERGEVRIFDGHLRRFHAQRLLQQSGNFNPWEWEGTLREGVNVKMQGGTGVGMKRAMLVIRRRTIERGWWGIAFLINQVHDELLYEVREDIAKEFFAVVCHEMESAFPELDVPVLAEGGIGPNWKKAHA
jgi:DNA polymerase I-like protein with 3'-5' exonuclease and polymerase domains